jgi:DNA-binding GntR family transcriptional regulator
MKIDEKTVLASAVYDALKERIMDQLYPPGERLNIDALASDLALSPTPVREALARLSAERLVTFEPYKGYRVSPLLTFEQVVDLLHVRRLLEVDAAQLAARRIRLPDLYAMDQLIAESAAAEVGSWSHGYRHFNQLDKRFHELLLAAADNRFLLEAHRSLNVHVELGRFYRVFAEMDQKQTCAEHAAIYRALQAHDPARAVAAVETHLTAVEQRIRNFFEQQVMRPSANGSRSEGNL